jgi:hypothetical protein
MFVSLWCATEWLQQRIQPISRRLVNLSYILWIVSGVREGGNGRVRRLHIIYRE